MIGLLPYCSDSSASGAKAEILQVVDTGNPKLGQT